MMLWEKIQGIFQKIQMTTASHRKQINVLNNLYTKNNSTNFYSAFEPFFRIVMNQDPHNVLYTKRCLCFVSQFCVASQAEQRDVSQNILYQLLGLALKFTSADAYNIRYNAALFVAILLQDVGEKIEIENEALDEVQEAMLRLIQDAKFPIRLQAVSALIRLQNPQDLDCPVIAAFKQALNSTNSRMRSEVLKHIAPNRTVFNDIRLKISDVDVNVRATAFRKCADMGPFPFKIIDKHKILRRGFHEDDPSVRSVFKNYFLSKWLTAFDGNFLKFIKSIKLNADERDMEQFSRLSTLLIEEFCRKNSFDEIVAVLPFENMVIKYEQLNNEVSMFWAILVKLLMESEEHNDEWKEVILPELTDLCSYIERFVKQKFTSNLDDWQSLQYQFDVMNLFEISKFMDFSDEVGRQNMKKLLLLLLKNYQFNYILTKKLVIIFEKCSTSIGSFTEEISELIEEIVKQKNKEQQLSKNDLLQRNFRLAEIKVKINVLKDSQHEAIAKRDFHTAAILQTDLQNCQTQLENLEKQLQEPGTNVRTEIENICKGLDVLCGVLELAGITTMTPDLHTIYEKFLIPLCSHKSVDISWRVLKCLGLVSLLDIEIAKKYYKVISKPLTLYTATEPTDKLLLIVSLSGVSDLLTFYGERILPNDDDIAFGISTKQTTIISTVNDTTTNTTNGTISRRLYKSGDGCDSLMTTVPEENYAISNVYEQLLKVLDDENEEIRFNAALTIAAFFKSNVPISPFLLSRLIIKWYSPLTEKDDNRVQYCIGKTIEEFISSKDCGEIFKLAIQPTLLTILNAPKTSPLSEIVIDNVVVFLAEICNMVFKPDAIKILSLDIQMKIMDKPQDKTTASLIKLLDRLDFDQTDKEGIEEVRRKSQMMLEVLPDKVLRRSVHRMIEKLCINEKKQTVIVEAKEMNDESTRNISNGGLQTTRCLRRNNNETNGELRKYQGLNRKKNRSNLDLQVSPLSTRSNSDTNGELQKYQESNRTESCNGDLQNSRVSTRSNSYKSAELKKSQELNRTVNSNEDLQKFRRLKQSRKGSNAKEQPKTPEPVVNDRKRKRSRRNLKFN